MFKLTPALAETLASIALCLFCAASAAEPVVAPVVESSMKPVAAPVGEPGIKPTVTWDKPATAAPPAQTLTPPPMPFPMPTVELKPPPPSLTTVDLTRPQDDLWNRIRNGFGMPDLDSPLVQQQQAWFLARPEYLRRVVERSRRYMYYIVDELEKRGMPTELALLPVVESAYNPMAYSRAHASGMWQFIPSTGKNYRLDQNWWMDQRRDIIASTGAALDYLQTIYEMQGDWHLALASYNWGENAVANAISKNKAKGLPTDYLSLTMPKETQAYVPKLQALKNIVAQPELFNITLDPIPNVPYFETVDIPANMDVAVAARLAEMTVEEFLALNPALNRPVILDKGKGGNSAIVLPAEKVDVFFANLASHRSHNKPLTNWQAYTIKNGETLESVAKTHGLTVARLKQVNGISPKMRVRPGHTLLVPAKPGVAASNLLSVNLPVATPDDKPEKTKGKAGKRQHGKKTAAKNEHLRTAKKPATKNEHVKTAKKPATGRKKPL